MGSASNHIQLNEILLSMHEHERVSPSNLNKLMSISINSRHPNTAERTMIFLVIYRICAISRENRLA